MSRLWIFLLSIVWMSAYSQNGEKLYKKHQCQTCHGAEGKKPISKDYPRLDGQNWKYLYQQIKDIKEGKRKNGKSSLMKSLISSLSDGDMKAISQYLSRVGQPTAEPKKESTPIAVQEISEKTEGIYTYYIEKKAGASAYVLDSNGGILAQHLTSGDNSSAQLDSLYVGSYSFEDTVIVITNLQIIDTVAFEEAYGKGSPLKLYYQQDSTGFRIYDPALGTYYVSP